MSYTKTNMSYSDRHNNVKLLKFKDYYEYQLSPLWDIIRRTVIANNCNRCEGLRCKRTCKVIQVHHLAYSMPVLLGINPGCLISLCKDCHTWCEFDDNGKKINDTYVVRSRTLFCVSNFRYLSGSNRNIGTFFKTRFALHQDCAQLIFKRLREQHPEWALLTIKWLYFGVLPYGFVDYLRIQTLMRKVRSKSTKRMIVPSKFSNRQLEQAKSLSKQLNQKYGKR